jgi:hypothetical protein
MQEAVSNNIKFILSRTYPLNLQLLCVSSLCDAEFLWLFCCYVVLIHVHYARKQIVAKEVEDGYSAKYAEVGKTASAFAKIFL